METITIKENKDPVKFWGNKQECPFLSNFYASPITINGITWQTSEHYYQSCKTKSSKEKAEIHNATSPTKAKAIGRKVTLRKNWDKIKDKVMMTALVAKFAQNTKIRDMLLETGDRELIEDSPDDYYWGCGKEGNGQNKLGKLLMVVRDHFRAMLG
jgi:ribA/ribD-fused uncharacterized protein